MNQLAVPKIPHRGLMSLGIEVGFWGQTPGPLKLIPARLNYLCRQNGGSEGHLMIKKSVFPNFAYMTGAKCNFSGIHIFTCTYENDQGSVCLNIRFHRNSCSKARLNTSRSVHTCFLGICEA